MGALVRRDKDPLKAVRFKQAFGSLASETHSHKKLSGRADGRLETAIWVLSIRCRRQRVETGIEWTFDTGQTA